MKEQEGGLLLESLRCRCVARKRRKAVLRRGSLNLGLEGGESGDSFNAR